MTDIQELLSKPVWQMTGEEFIFLSKHASGHVEALPQPVTDTEKKYVYGILGIACKKRSRLLQQKRRCCYSSDVAKLMFSS